MLKVAYNYRPLRRGASKAGGCSFSAQFTTLNYAADDEGTESFAEYAWDEIKVLTDFRLQISHQFLVGHVQSTIS